MMLLGMPEPISGSESVEAQQGGLSSRMQYYGELLCVAMSIQANGSEVGAVTKKEKPDRMNGPTLL
jgi:hypothetical protein